jgi:hypothetical protein
MLWRKTEEEGMHIREVESGHWDRKGTRKTGEMGKIILIGGHGDRHMLLTFLKLITVPRHFCTYCCSS